MSRHPCAWGTTDEKRYLKIASIGENPIPILKGYIIGSNKRTRWGKIDREDCLRTARMYLQKLGYYT